MRYMPWKYPAKPLLTVIIFAISALLPPSSLFAAEETGHVIAEEGVPIQTPVWCGNEMVLVYRRDPQGDMEHGGLGTEAIDLGSGKRFFVSNNSYEGVGPCNGPNGQVLLDRFNESKVNYGQRDIHIFDLTTRKATLIATMKEGGSRMSEAEGHKILVLGLMRRARAHSKAGNSAFKIYESKQPFVAGVHWEAAWLPNGNERIILYKRQFLLESEQGSYPLTFKHPDLAQVAQSSYGTLKTSASGRVFFLAENNSDLPRR